MYEIVVGEILAAIVAMYALYSLNKLLLANKLIDAERKLRARIANFESNYSNIRANPQDVVGGALGDLGIGGIIEQLGIDPKILANPLVKGLIEKYAPRVIEHIAKQGKIEEKRDGFI